MYSRNLKKISPRQEEVLVRLVIGIPPATIAEDMGMNRESVYRIKGSARGKQRLSELNAMMTQQAIKAAAIAPVLKGVWHKYPLMAGATPYISPSTRARVADGETDAGKKEIA